MKAVELAERNFLLEDERDPLRTIRGCIAYPSGADEGDGHIAYVLVLHGFKGFMDWGFFPELARAIAAAGFAAVRFNFSGSGVGEDRERFTEPRAFFENTPSREIDDVERVRAWLDAGAVPWIDAKRGAIVGHSLGGAAAIVHAARRRDYRALVLWSSVATFRRFPPEVESVWRRQGFVEIPNVRTQEIHRLGVGWLEDLEHNARALDVVEACRSIPTPTLLLHGAQDETVPLVEGRALAEAFRPGSARLEVVPDGDHTFGTTHPIKEISPALQRVIRATTGFLRETLA